MDSQAPPWLERVVLSGVFTAIAYTPTETGQWLREYMAWPLYYVNQDLWLRVLSTIW